MKYTIQPTRAGDFIVRRQDGREMAKLTTEAKAQTWIDQKTDGERVEAEARQQQQAGQVAFDSAVPDLNQAQIRWQTWRNWFYGEMRHEARRTSQMRKHLDSLDSNLSSYTTHEQHLTEDQERLASAQALYEQAVALDNRIKQARYKQHAGALTEVLAEAETMIDRMNEFFPAAARPEEKSRRAGTKPNASLVLTEAELEFIDRVYGGSKSAAIHDGLRRLMADAR
jgi:hypothetical protein